MKKRRTPSQAEILRLGPVIAALKVSMKPKRWRQFVRQAHKRGFTVQGALSGAPDALKERTNASLRKQATNTVAAAYKPVFEDLSRRETAAGYLRDKRAADDAAYRTWLDGELGKIDSQARAADATLATQQSDIAADLTASRQAAAADSLKRMAALTGGVSNPAESTALDQSAADNRSAEQVAAARTHSAKLTEIGDDADTIARAAMIATAAVREATGAAENWKTMAEISGERSRASGEQAKDTAGMIQDLKAGEVSKAQTREELSLAGAELGVKRQSILADAKEARQKYRLDRAKFNLDRWKAEHADAVARAKVELGYDQIVERQGRAAADRKLRKWVEEYRAKHNGDGGGGKGGDAKVSDDERKLYRSVRTVQSLIRRKRGNGKTDAQIRQDLRTAGYDDVMIDVANDLTLHNGTLTPAGKHAAKRLGITHVGYFFDVVKPTENLGQSGHA